MKRWHRLLRAVAGGALLLLTLVGCGFFSELVDDGDSAPKRRLDASKITDAVPRVEAKSARGNHSPYTVFGQQYRVWPSVEGYRQRGEASWYGVKFHGRLTSSGERYDMYKMTAAHKHLPLPSYVEVKNLDNGDKYEGEMKNGKMQGKGVYLFANGEKYEGEFKDDMFEGKGVYYYPDGTKKTGIFKKDELIKETK